MLRTPPQQTDPDDIPAWPGTWVIAQVRPADLISTANLFGALGIHSVIPFLTHGYNGSTRYEPVLHQYLPCCLPDDRLRLAVKESRYTFGDPIYVHSPATFVKQLCQLCKVVKLDPSALAYRGFHKGDKVRVTDGRLMGVEGTFDRNDRGRIFIVANFIQRGASVNLFGAGIEKID